MTPHLGSVITEGKTKIVREAPGGMAIFTSKDDLTAGNGAKHEILPGKGALANQTTCNVFSLLKANGIPVAFERKIDETSFLGNNCQMLLYEVVIRAEAYGSYLKRYPKHAKGDKLRSLPCEFFLKTTGQKWGEYTLVVDDPLIDFQYQGEDPIALFDPGVPMEDQDPFLVLQPPEVFTLPDESDLIEEMEEIARQSFIILQKSWREINHNLVDFKVEFGINRDRKLVLADVIDNDSWRLVNGKEHKDKQFFREGGKLEEVLKRYTQVAEMTNSPLFLGKAHKQ